MLLESITQFIQLINKWYFILLFKVSILEYYSIYLNNQ